MLCHELCVQKVYKYLLRVLQVLNLIISDIGMYQLLDKCRRCGISYIFQRYSKANNVCIKAYNEPTNHLIYEDPKNLFRHTIPKFLSDNRFKLIFKKKKC